MKKYSFLFWGAGNASPISTPACLKSLPQGRQSGIWIFRTAVQTIADKLARLGEDFLRAEGLSDIILSAIKFSFCAAYKPLGCQMTAEHLVGTPPQAQSLAKKK
jgi:hypothetical protein